MRRIALFFVGTVAIIVLLFSYKTSWPASSVRPALGSAAHIRSAPAVVTGNPVTTSAPPPDLTELETSKGVTTAATGRADAHRPATKNVSTPKAKPEPKTSAASRTAAATTAAAAPVVADGSAVDTTTDLSRSRSRSPTTRSPRSLFRCTPLAADGTWRSTATHSRNWLRRRCQPNPPPSTRVSGATYTSQDPGLPAICPGCRQLRQVVGERDSRVATHRSRWVRGRCIEIGVSGRHLACSPVGPVVGLGR